MPNTQILKQRIKSVGNIRQITKAMELVAASKLRRAQEAALRSRAYTVAARAALTRLRQAVDPAEHALFAERPVEKQLLIIFSSDRGLAGSYNTNIFKEALDQIQQAEKESISTAAIAVGNKAAQFVSKLGGTVEGAGAYTNWPVEPDIEAIRPIVHTATKQFTAGEVDRVHVVYTDFESTLKQRVVTRTVLPIDPVEATDESAVNHEAPLFEPSAKAVLDYVVPRLVEVQLYQASVEAVASEQAMRMVAMKNASDNADDLTKDLTQTFNGVRQATITQELAEITSGAEALQS